MALTVFETTEQQLLPCQQAVEQGAGDGGAAAAGAEKATVTLKETDRGGDDDRPERDDIWNMIQAQKPPPPAAPRQAPYVHPLVRRSSSLLTQKSLEICTESLGSETGSDGFSDADGSATEHSCQGSDDERGEGEEEEEEVVAQRAAPPRAFPPPLPSLARRKVESTMEMRQKRQDGRLLVKVVPVASSTLFRAQRRGGRLLLSFADTAAPAPAPASDEPETEQQADEEDDEEDEVEVVDRGTVVEVKVSAQPQARSGRGPRVHRSALVINKFVGAEPVTSCEIDGDGDGATAPQHPVARRSTGSTTTAVAALAAASALSAAAAPPDSGDDAVPGATCGENKLLMTAKRHSSKEELMKHMRRCSGQLSPSLFVWEGCIATSS
ncbi:protein FAF-like, chloroplastic [Zea mays]|uniref:Protein FAF-like chloroplastic n=1 Tax=Zea mays TaxID=4577 RepID=A0A1D6JWU8_MAIZE|nr:protein FAF-like, chloroplastic [Zea mays]ONL96213.1 Protein FAF-like chloroplastic [Zea mays]|eukprot:XP_008653896.1 protein FAF-like, chloroplastic [Zea mays]